MKGKGRERKGKEGKGRERKGKEGERKGKEGKGRERKGKEGKGRGKEGKGRGKEGKGRGKEKGMKKEREEQRRKEQRREEQRRKVVKVCLLLLLLGFGDKAKDVYSANRVSNELIWGSYVAVGFNTEASVLKYQRKYIKGWTNTELLMKGYMGTKDVYEKMFIVERLCDFAEEEKVLDFVLKMIDYEGGEGRTKGLKSYWKLQVSGLYNLGLKGESLSDKDKVKVQELAKKLFREGKDARVEVSAGITLSKLVVGGEAKEVKEAKEAKEAKEGKHRLLKRETISQILNKKMFLVGSRRRFKEDAYMAWGLGRAALELNEKETILGLRYLRKGSYPKKVLKYLDKVISELESR